MPDNHNMPDDTASELPESFNLQLEKAADLRYGENPHQLGARYRFAESGSWWDTVRQHGGKQLSYLNLNDGEAAWRLVCALGSAGEGHSAAVVVKHANPCGAALADDITTAWERAHGCDPISAFGGVAALNRPVDACLAEKITDTFLEVLVAPDYDETALPVLAKKKNMRVIQANHSPAASIHFRSIDGGLLVQKADPLPDFNELQKSQHTKIVTKRSPTPKEMNDLAFAWVIVAATQSNAIVFVKDLQAIGVGAGQQNRRDAAMLAAHKAGDRSKGSACASDAFFPFRDGLDQAAAAGCTAIIQPGGSVRDAEVIAAADEQNITMLFTHQRCFLH